MLLAEFKREIYLLDTPTSNLRRIAKNDGNIHRLLRILDDKVF